MKKLFFFFIFTALSVLAHAQELNAKVSINHSQVSNTKTEVMDALQEKMQAFLNDHRWTEMRFKEVEKIECNFNVTVNTWSETDNSFTCTLLVTSSRPVYNSSYTTTVYSTRDDNFNFAFQASDQLEWNPDNVDNNLTALLAYYAYVIIGYDMDSFSPLGGTTYLQQAEDIVTNAQSLGYDGWTSFNDNKNRFGLLNDYMDGSMEQYRQMIYKYHREGMDKFTESADSARASITEVIMMLDDVRSARPMTQLPQLFTEYKKDELVNIYQGKGTSDEKDEVYRVVFAINPSMSEDWERIKK